jgi:hypothetical protein
MKSRYLSFFIRLLILSSVASCTQRIYLKRINAYLNAPDAGTKERYMAYDYHSYFSQKKGEGEDKTASLESFSRWDASLNPDIKILSYSVANRRWQIDLNEQNDFSKSIGYPGWKAKEILILNKKGFIKEAIYIPDPASPSYKKWLQPAVEWLQKNIGDSLNHVYQNGKLIQTAATAREWVTLLKRWRDSIEK